MKKITHSIKDIIATAFLVIDLFCGAGGTTTGFAMTDGIAKVIACVNHDKNAIISHWQNHPEVKHFEEDIRTLDLTELIALVKHNRALYPNAKIILWASLECTNFSKAKGGKARDADSRTLADHLERYIIALDPDIIQIENVVEFMSWGPLDENGKPISKRNGSEWIRWRNEICAIGYFDDWKEMNAADYGAYTSRNRLFGMFAKRQDWIVWPEPTHLKNPGKGGLFTQAEKWKPVKEVLDFDDEGNSIFGRKKDLSPKTLERIYAGLVKYVANGDTSFIAKYYSGKPEGKVISIHGPAGTIRCSDGQAIINTHFIQKHNSGNPSGMVTSIEAPAGTLTTKAHQSIVGATFLAKYYGNGHNIQSVEEPAGTIPTKDRFIKVQAAWLDKYYNGAHNHQSVESPAGVIMPNDKHRKVQADFLFNKNSSTAPCVTMEGPAPTITCRGQAKVNASFLVNPQWGSKTAQSVDNPCFTLIARMDKAPPSLVFTEAGEPAIEILDTDAEPAVKIKMFMAAYGIIDIKMRMLKVPELLKIQGFPDGYKLAGTQTEQKKFIGNSVEPHVVCAWTISLNNHQEKIAA